MDLYTTSTNITEIEIQKTHYVTKIEIQKTSITNITKTEIQTSSIT